MTAYRDYILGPVWAERRDRHLARRPTCVAHGRGCRARTVHHASYWGWRHLGVELPWEKVSLCRPAHDRISRWHRGRWISNPALFALTWAIVGWTRLWSGPALCQSAAWPARKEQQDGPVPFP